MKKTFPFLIALVTLLSACQGKKAGSLAEFMDLEKIEKVEMFNNSGRFVLNPAQLSQIKKDLSLLTHDPGMSAKVGAIHLKINIEGQEHAIVTSTHGDYAEVDASMLNEHFDKSEKSYAYFRMNGVNFDNYKKTD